MMFGYFRDMAFRGLVNNVCRKLSASMNLPKEAASLCVPMAVMIAHASYPKARTGNPELDAAIRRLPQPIVGWDAAGKIAHRFAYLHELTLNECLQQQYGKSLQELMVLFEAPET